MLHRGQFGFTEGKSTTDAGVKLLECIFDAWENNKDAIGVFCDLSKAFDCVKHNILISKLEHYGVRDKANKLLISYLTGRNQNVDINGVRSSGSNISIGVPQGSILGPFLFLVYVNDLPMSVQGTGMCDMVLFADDTSLLFKVEKNKLNYDDVNFTLSCLLYWFTSNNLLLNSSKTKCVKFSLQNTKTLALS